MKDIFKITLLTIIMAFAIIIVRYYIVNANTENLIFEDNINTELVTNQEIVVETNRGEETTRDSVQKHNVEDLIVKDEKYTTEYEANGETFKIVGSLKIPKLNIEYDIYGEASEELMKLSLIHYWGANPNQIGNMCIIGHNYLDYRFFGRIHTLNNGDCIEITDGYGGILKYYVYDKYVVNPNDTSCTSQLTNGEKEITLITCYKEGTNRLVVKARAKKENTNVIKEIIDIFK